VTRRYVVPVVAALVLAVAACGDDDDGPAMTHANLAEQIGCTGLHAEVYPTTGEVADCTLAGDTVHLRVFDSNDDRDRDLDMIRGVCEAFETDDDVTWFEGDRWAINAAMGAGARRAIEAGTGVEPVTVEC
jgi:hypothetical protein